MAAPPKKKSKDSILVRLVVEKWKPGQSQQISAVQRVAGFPWRLRLYKKAHYSSRSVDLICDMANEAELWRCIASIKTTFFAQAVNAMFSSWNHESQTLTLPIGAMHIEMLETEGSILAVEITTKDNGEIYRPSVELFEQRDGVLVIGDEKKKVYVLKKSLASQSPYFDRLFFGDFKEKNMSEIPIEDVEYKEFTNLLNMVYGMRDVQLTDENVHRVLALADRFQIKIVEDRVVSFLLSSSSTLSIHQQLLLSDRHSIGYFKDYLLLQYTAADFDALKDSEELNQLSIETVRALFKKSRELK